MGASSHGNSALLQTCVRAAFATLAALPVAAAECQCLRLRCRSELGEFVFAPSDMLTLEAIWCVGNSSAFQVGGDCEYCATDCQDDICECRKSISCDWLSIVVAVICFLVTVTLILLACRSAYRHWRLGQVRSYETPAFVLETWEKQPSVAVLLPLGCSLFTMSLGIAFVTVRQTEFNS
mmetsp:Transcript_62006/g.134438  ORF Transcript_62006/g.134438 Transcript_62006/m.134438 type:complete len:179 (-) Transcript_62006:63-599(-)